MSKDDGAKPVLLDEGPDIVGYQVKAALMSNSGEGKTDLGIMLEPRWKLNLGI